jgi:hypothetical protein
MPELDSHLSRTHLLLLSEYDTAFLLFPSERILQKERLINRHFGCQDDQCAMGVDHQRTGPFGKSETLLLGSVSNDGNAKDDPLATSFLVPNHLSLRVGFDQILAEFQL